MSILCLTPATQALAGKPLSTRARSARQMARRQVSINAAAATKTITRTDVPLALEEGELRRLW